MDVNIIKAIVYKVGLHVTSEKATVLLQLKQRGG